VSGGSKGARLGPSIMPGGDKEAYELIRPIFEKASAKVSGDPCVSFLGKTSAGHYVKMIHNGIEYAMMQLISEVYHVLRYGMDKSNDEIHQIFSTWNEGTLNSYLIEITGDIFSAKDGESDTYLIDMILDKAKQKTLRYVEFSLSFLSSVSKIFFFFSPLPHPITTVSLGNSSLLSKAFRAGNNFLFARSPVTPKMTIMLCDFIYSIPHANISKQTILILLLLKNLNHIC
jgi:hypothetical protein